MHGSREQDRLTSLSGIGDRLASLSGLSASAGSRQWQSTWKEDALKNKISMLRSVNQDAVSRSSQRAEDMAAHMVQRVQREKVRRSLWRWVGPGRTYQAGSGGGRNLRSYLPRFAIPPSPTFGLCVAPATSVATKLRCATLTPPCRLVQIRYLVWLLHSGMAARSHATGFINSRRGP